jgi:uncharacterized protein (DUF4415 family)
MGRPIPSALEIAEAAFRLPQKNSEPDPMPMVKPAAPSAKESVTLRIDRDVSRIFKPTGHARKGESIQRYGARLRK